jgi:hypothetical protein
MISLPHLMFRRTILPRILRLVRPSICSLGLYVGACVGVMSGFYADCFIAFDEAWELWWDGGIREGKGDGMSAASYCYKDCRYWGVVGYRMPAMDMRTRRLLMGLKLRGYRMRGLGWSRDRCCIPVWSRVGLGISVETPICSELP